MDDFILDLMDLGARLDMASSTEEEDIILQKAILLYEKHVDQIEKNVREQQRFSNN